MGGGAHDEGRDLRASASVSGGWERDKMAAEKKGHAASGCAAAIEVSATCQNSATCIKLVEKQRQRP